MTNEQVFRVAVLAALIAILVAVPAALAGKGGTKGGGGPSRMSGSFRLVLVDSTDGLAHHGQRVKFDVTTTAPWPFVDLDCTQAGTLVYHSTIGYYGGWESDTFTLGGWAWPSGEADCTARLYDGYGGDTTTLATLSFHVFA